MEKKYQLPKEFATKWVEALRSGDFKQGNLWLLKDNEYCCLGVACVASGMSVEEIDNKKLIDEHNFTALPKCIPPLLVGNLSQPFVGNVANMNDDGVPFTEIADWIEANVEFVENKEGGE